MSSAALLYGLLAIPAFLFPGQMVCKGQQADTTSMVHELGITPVGYMDFQGGASNPFTQVPGSFTFAHSLFYKIRKNDHTLRFGASYIYTEVKGKFSLDSCRQCFETRGFNHFLALWAGQQQQVPKLPASDRIIPYYGVDGGLYLTSFSGKFTYSQAPGTAVTTENTLGIFISPFAGIRFDFGSRLTLSTEINMLLNLGLNWHRLDGNGLTQDKKGVIGISTPSIIEFRNLLNISYRFR